MQTKNFKTLFLMAVFLGLAYAEVSYVWGVQGASITDGGTSRADFADDNGAVYQAQAGNVTQLNIDGKSITTHWTGFYGNISGNVTLEDASGNVFYDWTGLGVPAGEVFAANQSSVTWAGIGCASAGEITAINSFLGLTGTDPDRIENTYTANNHASFSVAGVDITGNSCNTTNAYSSGVKNTSVYTQVLLTDSGGVPLFTTLINDSATGFDDASYDFQLLAGARESAITPLYFYIELG